MEVLINENYVWLLEAILRKLNIVNKNYDATYCL